MFEAIRHRMKTKSLRQANSLMIVGRNRMYLGQDSTRIWTQYLVPVVLDRMDVMWRSRECIGVVGSSGGGSS